MNIDDVRFSVLWLIPILLLFAYALYKYTDDSNLYTTLCLLSTILSLIIFFSCSVFYKRYVEKTPTETVDEYNIRKNKITSLNIAYGVFITLLVIYFVCLYLYSKK